MEPPDNGPWYVSQYNWFKSLYKRFDASYLNISIAEAANHAFFVCVDLSVKDYFKNYLKLDPGEQQMYMSIIRLPWSLKILYGLVSDNVPLYGTRRKSWIMSMGLLQFFVLMILALTEPKDPFAVSMLLFFASLS